MINRVRALNLLQIWWVKIRGLEIPWVEANFLVLIVVVVVVVKVMFAHSYS